MNEEKNKNIPSEMENQNIELTEDQLDEVNGGASRLTIRIAAGYRKCAANPAHVYVARNPNDVCPFCGAKEYTETRGF